MDASGGTTDTPYPVRRRFSCPFKPLETFKPRHAVPALGVCAEASL